jgi:hypothetical protein
VWAAGGSTLYIEAAVKDEGTSTEHAKPGLVTTGQMGDVMKESSSIAYSFARGILRGGGGLPQARSVELTRACCAGDSVPAPTGS